MKFSVHTHFITKFDFEDSLQYGMACPGERC